MSATIEVQVPDIGDFDEVEVIELLVKPGDTVKPEQSLITVESEKASMEIPSAAAGVVRELRVKLGDKVSQGSVVLVLDATDEQPQSKAPATTASPVATPAPPTAVPPAPATAAFAPAVPTTPVTPPAEVHTASVIVQESSASSAPSGAGRPSSLPDAPQDQVVKPHASPSVRQFARELGVDLHKVRGSGPKQRITHEDVRGFVKSLIAQAGQPSTAAAPPAAAAVGGLQVLPWPKVDFTKFGPTESVALSRIKKISGANLHRNWVMIPHVTNHDDADITELEAFRIQLNREQEKAGLKVTMLAFLIKACVAALKRFPEFNASLDGENLVLKRYYHIGFAADTPNGLVVPVVRDADRKGVLQLARETAELAAKARDGKLAPGDMQGGCFSISSLGGIGGSYFTPIINAPEVAILGVCRANTRPHWDGQQFVPRLSLPLSLSYDHRVIDGAAAARFNAYLAQLLADFRRAML